MLQAFIITLREGVEAALIVGITLAYLAKIGRAELRKTVYAALGAAFLGSIAVAGWAGTNKEQQSSYGSAEMSKVPMRRASAVVSTLS